MNATDTRCDTRTGTVRCDQPATHLVTRAAIPATTYFPESPAIETLQCGEHAAMWTRTKNGRPVHPGMTAELV